jgi:hypothetical protein
MIEGGVGGANTQTGLKFEKDTDLREALLSKQGITISGSDVHNNGTLIGKVLQKHSLYREFLDLNGVAWREILSKKLLPDEAYYSIKNKKLIIVEKKFQQTAGSVDEKLQTCGFKKKQYEKLCKPINNVTVEYVYVLNDWFKDKSYKDVLDYIEEVGCHYYFNELPFNLFDID